MSTFPPLGGTYVEAWSSPDALAKCPPNAERAETPKRDVSFSSESAATLSEDTNPSILATTPSLYTSSSSSSSSLLTNQDSNSVLWNAMIVPFLRFPIYGAIWYQAEADAADPVDALCMCVVDWISSHVEMIITVLYSSTLSYDMMRCNVAICRRVSIPRHD